MTLKYNDDGHFKIMQITDLHLGGLPANENDQKTYSDLEKIVVENKPDLLIFTGDIIYSLEEHGAKDPEATFLHFVNFINKLNVKTAITFGNHDAEKGKTSREKLRAIYEKSALLKAEKTKTFIIADRENYVLEIKSSYSDKVQNAIFILDSGAYSETEYSYYAWLLPEQVMWYKDTVKNYHHNDGVLRHLIFQHIPLPEYWYASRYIQAGAFNESLEMNTSWVNAYKNSSTEKLPFENYVGSPEINTGMFFEMVNDGETWGMFVGHDHDNSFDSKYKGIRLVYGQSSGYNTYGTEPKGIRMIELNEYTQVIETYSLYYNDLK